MATIPARSVEQRQEALGRANEVRFRRAALKREMRAGRGDVLGLIADPPAWLETMKIFDLLIALPRWGQVRANGVLHRLLISPSKTVGGLTVRQRGELLWVLEGRA